MYTQGIINDSSVFTFFKKGVIIIKKRYYAIESVTEKSLIYRNPDNSFKEAVMATSADFIEFVCEQIHGDYNVRYTKMFGEYMVYVNDKPVLLVCDNTVFVKKLPELDDLMSLSDSGTPYNGAKEHYILDIENAPLLEKAIAVLEQVAPLPKKRTKKTSGNL